MNDVVTEKTDIIWNLFNKKQYEIISDDYFLSYKCGFHFTQEAISKRDELIDIIFEAMNLGFILFYYNKEYYLQLLDISPNTKVKNTCQYYKNNTINKRLSSFNVVYTDGISLEDYNNVAGLAEYLDSVLNTSFKDYQKGGYLLGLTLKNNKLLFVETDNCYIHRFTKEDSNKIQDLRKYIQNNSGAINLLDFKYSTQYVEFRYSDLITKDIKDTWGTWGASKEERQKKSDTQATRVKIILEDIDQSYATNILCIFNGGDNYCKHGLKEEWYIRQPHKSSYSVAQQLNKLWGTRYDL